LTGIVALPYTPKMLDYLTPLQIFYIVKALDMRLEYDVPNIMDILKQKLLDLFYLVEDNPRLHGVVPCQSNNKPCHSIASIFCANHCCKICCQDGAHRMPCIMHDRYEEFFKYKTRSVYEFEEGCMFDRSRTLRIHCRRLIRRHDLEKAFEGVNVAWDEMRIYNHYSAHKIEYVYLVFDRQETALRILEDKHVYAVKLGNTPSFDLGLIFL
jgi:hypothetical protein